ncbi:MAG TPA: hypothetical protein VD996_17210 [Chitinophagaceae bacterium]|nr:hypothetical protein [Chitinophagaceae bacterium]
MKQLFSLSILLFFTALAMAQAPQAINYQGVARNAGGAPFASQQISVRLSIRTGTPEGPAEYSETRAVQTNQFGLFSVQVGSSGATNVQGNFAAINWSEGNKFLQTEISVNGQPYVNIGVTQMMSVPFSLHSKESKDLILPFSKTVNINNADVFKLRSEAQAPYSTIIAESVNGVALQASSENNIGLSGITRAKNRHAIAGTALSDSANGVHGSVHFIYKDGVGVSGDGTVNGIGVRGKSINKAGVQGFSEKNYGVYGQSKDFDAVAGSSFAMAGVSGSSVNGVGVIGLSEKGNGAIYGSAGQYTPTSQFGVMGEAFGNSTGVLAKSNSSTATALVVDGKLKITNNGSFPGEGKVLTSDALGNATWQPPVSVAFRASGLRNDADQSIPSGTAKKVLFFQQARYNIGNAYDAENSIFFVPVAGIYHLYAQVNWTGSSPHAIFSIKLLRNGTVTTIAETRSGSYTPSDVVTTPSVTTDIALQPNDAVWIEISQSNESGSARNLVAPGYSCWFTGHLLTKL